MKVASGEHKCITLTEVSELTEFMLNKALSRNGFSIRFPLTAASGKRLTQEESKDIDFLETTYKLDGRSVLKTSLSMVNPHKGSLLLSYWVMDWT